MPCISEDTTTTPLDSRWRWFFFAVCEIQITASPSRPARQLQQLLSRSDPRRRIYNVLCAPTI